MSDAFESGLRIGRRPLLAAALASAVGAALPPLDALAAAGPPRRDDPRAFLRWSLARHTALRTYRAEGTWSLLFGKKAFRDVQEDAKTVRANWRLDVRTVAYAAPNRFRVTSDNMGQGDLVHVYVCDGAEQVNIAEGYSTPVKRFPAPATLAAAETSHGNHPHFGGSVLYRFFSGGDDLAVLLDGDRPVTFGPDATLDGERCRTVRFFAHHSFGDTRVAISTRDGLVRRIDYFQPAKKLSADVMRSIETGYKRAGTKGKPPKSLPACVTTELYTNIVADGPMPGETFRIDV